MHKRPVSLTVIAWVIIVLSLFGVAGLVMAGTNPVMAKALEQMHMSLGMYRARIEAQGVP